MKTTKIGIRITLTIFISLCILNTSFTTIVANNEVGISKSVACNTENVFKDVYDYNNEVTVIVELRDSSLLDHYINDKKNTFHTNSETFKEYMTSSKARDIKGNILKIQNKVKSSIQKVIDSHSNIKILYNYSSIINGFAITIPYGEIQTLKTLPYVKNVYVSPVFKTLGSNVSSNNNLTNVATKLNVGLEGKGTVISIIDTGIDTKHVAFHGDVKSPKVTKNTIDNVINVHPLMSGIRSASETYVNSKIPYAYDYADSDDDVKSSESSIKLGNDHGTSVAGIIAANNTSIVPGIAPEAQILVMKVFSDTSSSVKMEDVLAALEDSITLGADVINLSIGEIAGFSNEGVASINRVYNNIIEAGINLSVAAGNNGASSLYNAIDGYSLSSNPDYATVSAPSTYPAATSVASIINDKIFRHYFTVGQKKIAYEDIGGNNQPSFNSLAGEISYIKVPGSGEISDYKGINVKGKVVVLCGNNNSITSLVTNAINAGAVAVVIYKIYGVNFDITEQTADWSIPVISVSEADGTYLSTEKNKKIMCANDVFEFTNDLGMQLSDTSAWGVSPNLELKPEIAAPGEDVYSTLPFNKYGIMSGTSMAAAYITGAYAIVRERINTNKLSVKTTTGKLATQLLMSTAVPISNQEGVLYSPRKQGSGVVNIDNAVKTTAYLYTDESIEKNSKPKLNLYDDKNETGIFTSQFHLVNIDEKAVTYTIDKEALTEKILLSKYGLNTITESPGSVAKFVNLSVKVKNGRLSNNKITVDAKSDAKIIITLTMSKDLKNYYIANFPNGGFLDGFILLHAPEGKVNLSIPYVGFFGDWTRAPLFDEGSAYNLNGYSQTFNVAYTNNGEAYLGINPFDEHLYDTLKSGINPYCSPNILKQNTMKPDIHKIAISPNDDGCFDSFDYFQISLLRNAKQLKYKITDSNGNIVNSGTQSYVSKSIVDLSSKKIIPTIIKPSFNGKNKDGKPYKNNTVFTFTINGILDYSKHENNNTYDTISIPITIDLEKPIIKKVKKVVIKSKTYMDVTVSDNQFVSNVCAYVKGSTGSKQLISKHLLNKSNKNETSIVRLDVSDAVTSKKKVKDIIIVAYDYALNSAFINKKL